MLLGAKSADSQDLCKPLGEGRHPPQHGTADRGDARLVGRL